jgi:hypothetical protein
MKASKAASNRARWLSKLNVRTSQTAGPKTQPTQLPLAA